MLKFEVVRGPTLDGSVDLLAVATTGKPSAKDPILGPLGKTLGVDLGVLADEELFEGKAEQQLALSGRDRVPAKRILLLGLDTAAPGYLRVRMFAAAAVRHALGLNLRRVGLAFPDLAGLDTATWIEAAMVGARTGAYRFTRYLTGDRKPKAEVETVVLCTPPAGRLLPPPRLEELLARAAAVAGAIDLARDLVNEPPNVMTPRELARRAEDVAERGGLECEVWDRKRIVAEGMNLLAAVNAGSREEPRFIQLRYRPEKPSKRRVVLIGKGLTFDAGGLCLKPPKGMQDMKCDMSGGALVIGLMAAVAARKPKAEVIALVPSTENMPGGAAARPGDVVAAYGGKTVEIINTDAEGRLILADTLGYARKLEPTVILDHATLTGACMVALGPYAAGLFSNSDPETERLLRAASATGEQFWRLPLAEDLKDMLHSDVADVKNVGEQFGGAITAALFLRHFVDRTPWLHLDIAGPAYLEKATSYAPRGGTGFGIPTLLRFIEP
ncbi:MAG: leucyl aminopeptidase [Deltaproteobacteria bacterium]|nr:leucyl aminopeptidase [Deltaproteobacteria bacterium]